MIPTPTVGDDLVRALLGIGFMVVWGGLALYLFVRAWKNRE